MKRTTAAVKPQSTLGWGKGCAANGSLFFEHVSAVPDSFLSPHAPELGHDLIMGHGNALAKPRLGGCQIGPNTANTDRVGGWGA